MALYWERRPVFEAVQLIEENVEDLKRITGQDVGFSDTNCFIHIEQSFMTIPMRMWLIKPPRERMYLLHDVEFHEQFESTPKTVKKTTSRRLR